MKSKFLFVMSVAGAMLLASCNQQAPSPATTTQETTSTPAGTSVETPEVVSVSCTVENDELEVGKTLTLDPVVTVKGGANKRCEFKSSDDKIATVNSNGVVTGVAEGEVKITITSVVDSTKKTEVTLHIVPVKVVAIKDFVVNQEYTVTGKVVAVNTRSFVIHDGTGAVMVYLNAAPAQEIGQVVEVSGKVTSSAYTAGLVQFDSKATIKESDKVIDNIPEAVELLPATVDAWVAAYQAAENKEGQIFKQDEMKLYKWTTTAVKDGSYDVIKVDGSDVVIEPVYADGSVYKFTEGKKYDVEGYFAGYRVTSSGSAYAQIVLTKAEEKQAQPGEVFVTADKKAILIDEVATLTATIEQGGDAVVQWSLKEANMGQVVELAVDAENGNKATVKGLAAGEAIVVATNGNFSFETKITVSAIAEVAISNITEAGKVYSATGVVAALTSKGFVLSDGAASIYVFMNAAPTVVVGDLVNVEGGVSAYNKVFQFSVSDKVKPVTVTKAEGNIPNLPVAVDLTAEIVAGWKDAKAVATTDVKLYKWTAKATKPGDYLMTNLEGCEIDIEPSNVPSDITLVVGKTYELEAYFGGFNNKNAYAAMYITKAEEVGGGEQTSEEGSQPVDSSEGGQSSEQIDSSEVAVEYVSVASVAEAGQVYAVKGAVAAVTTKGFVVSDGTGAIYVYLNAAPTVSVGDMVSVEGGVSARNKVFQFSVSDKVQAVTVTKIEENVPNLPVAVDLTAEIVAGWKDGTAFATTDVKLYKWTATATKPGKYIMTNLAGCEIDVEPSYTPTSLGLTVGKTYNLEAYFGGYDNTNKYAAMYLTKAEEVEVPVDSSEVVPVDSSEVAPVESSDIVPVESGEQGDAGIVATMAPGTNGSAVEVNGHAAIKVGTSKLGGDMTITVGAGATKLAFYAAAWKGVNGLSLNLTGATANPDSVSLTADEGMSNNSPFTLSGDESNYLFQIALSEITEETTITLASSAAKRFVVWGAVYYVD